MKRYYENFISEHFSKFRQMLFLMGPRQVGKTTISKHLGHESKKFYYFNWDDEDDRELIISGPSKVANKVNLDLQSAEPIYLIFDELHKYKRWKIFLKGFFDKYESQTKILVTGSAKIDTFRKGGDSLMGRYFPLKIHPLSIGEICNPITLTTHPVKMPKQIEKENFDHLLEFGGFPEPYFIGEKTFYQRWKQIRLQKLFREDLRDLTRIQEIDQIELLGEFIRRQAGQLSNYSSYSKMIRVSNDTIARWIKTLRSFYYCFEVRPWSKNVTRSLIKEPKLYLWDWSLVEDSGFKLENFVASHLLKSIHYWTDIGLGEFQLNYLRDKEKREVDFVVIKNKKPWFLLEVKSSSKEPLSPNLEIFQKQIGAEHAFQLAFDLDYIDQDCFEYTKPVIVSAKTFLSQLI
jgi:predicted AAA+ superfamily ATPase